jgi:tetratricopeptide (TPR) repeat protein
MKTLLKSPFTLIVVFLLVSVSFCPSYVPIALSEEKSEKDELKSIERLMETLEHEKAKAEWERVAPKLQHTKPRRVFVDQLADIYRRSIKSSLKSKKYREAIQEWERASFSHLEIKHSLLGSGGLLWDIPRAYIKIGESSKAIELFTSTQYFTSTRYIAPDSVEERTMTGEKLILGEVISPGFSENKGLVGKAQCTLCHAVSKGEWRQGCGHTGCGPELKGVSSRTKALLKTHEYLEQRTKGAQPESFPGSGVPSTVIEYLAESNVCPSCYVVPGGTLNYPFEHGKESRMPMINRASASLSRDEMMAVDTWILVQDGEEVPPISVMRAAYDKFLPKEDNPGSVSGLFLASLYDEAGNYAVALRLLEETYPIVWRRKPSESMLGYNMYQWRNDPEMFAHMKTQPDLVARFPVLLKPDESKKPGP